MVTDWVFRVHAITSTEDASSSNAFWTLIGPAGDFEALSYGIPLSANGQEPATHRGISSAFNREMLAMLKACEEELLNLRYYVCDAWTFELLDQRNGTAEIGEALDFNGALEDMGLQTIQPEELV